MKTPQHHNAITPTQCGKQRVYNDNNNTRRIPKYASASATRAIPAKNINSRRQEGREIRCLILSQHGHFFHMWFFNLSPYFFVQMRACWLFIIEVCRVFAERRSITRYSVITWLLFRNFDGILRCVDIFASIIILLRVWGLIENVLFGRLYGECAKNLYCDFFVVNLNGRFVLSAIKWNLDFITILVKRHCWLSFVFFTSINKSNFIYFHRKR